MIEVLLAILGIGYLMRTGGRRLRGGDHLPTILAGAERAGIITATQREQILAHAAEHGSRGRLGGAAWLGVFAGLFVVAGVSLLIARNWEAIGPLVRIAAYLLLLLAVGEAAVRLRDRSVGVALPLELLWFFLPLLGIGLYGQTFQLSGDPVQPFLIWLALSAPIAWLSPRPVTAAIHTAAMTLVLFVGNFIVDATASLIGGGRGPSGVLALAGTSGTPTAWALSFLLLAMIAVQSLRLLPEGRRHHFVGVWVLWTFGVLVSCAPLRLQHEGWIALAALALATLWVVVLAAMDASREERGTSLLAWLGTIYALTFGWHMTDPGHGEVTGLGIAVVILAVALAVGGAFALPPARLSPRSSWAQAGKLVLIAPVLVGMLFLASDVRLVWTAAILLDGLLVVTAVGCMWHGSLTADVAQINLGVLILVWVLISRFLDLFGSMLRSGIGFILAGVMLAALAWALERTRRRLIAAPREVAT